MEITVLVERGFGKYVRASWLRRITRQVLKAADASHGAEMSVVITGQEKIHRLNKQYLDEDAPTDVLSFPMLEDGGVPFVNPPDRAVHLGEVIISYPQAVKQAEARGHTVQKELATLLIHGTLHLLGHDHDVPKRESVMRGREAAILNLIEESL